MADALVLEFNEINRELLERLIGQGKLPNFARLLRTHALVGTTVLEEYSKLEPWIQWVTAHSGKPQEKHGAFNLSDVQHSELMQIWDVLEKRGVPCGVVSPMNARRGNLKRGFFIPDPWSTSKDAYPAAASKIYAFLAERVQSHNVSLEQGSSKWAFLLECLKLGVPFAALAKLGGAYIRARLDRRSKWKLAAELDRFLFELTLTLKRKFKTEYTSVFMNSVAHYQHHYWTRHEPDYWGSRYPALFAKRNPVAELNLHDVDDPILYGLQALDDVVGRAIGAVGVNSVMVVTGLSQIPFQGYEGGKGFYLYRPFDHERLFKALNVVCQRVAPLMSRDVMLYFINDLERQQAVAILESARVQGKSLFLFTQETESRLFCKVDYSFDAPAEAVVEALGVAPGSIRFHDYFLLITFKTGHHSPEGLVIAAKAALAATTSEPVMPLELVPKLIFNVMALGDLEQISSELILSSV